MQNIKGQKKAEYSKTLIMDALHSLMKTKPFDEISITEIADKAGVSRLTFYRNFDRKEDVIFMHSDRIRRGILKKFSGMEETPDLRHMLDCCFSIRESQKDICLLVHRDALLDPAYQRSWSLALDEFPFLHRLTYTRRRILMGGMYAILIDLIEGKNKIDKADAIESIIR
ncbi:MAG: TetR/AcrR family transcriptional regulator, partial [Oscillospiraceae bacterium]|nr:TetR/AcrR family transcriptional regulator [Oscillospiraceae bacterium]